MRGLYGTIRCITGQSPTVLQDTGQAQLINPAALVRSDPATVLALEETCALLCRYRKGRGWLLSTSQLAALLGVKSFSGKEFSRYGFTFTRVGRNGSESAWRVEKGTE